MTKSDVGAVMTLESAETLQKRIAYCIYVGVRMGRKAGKTATLMYDSEGVGDEEYAKRLAAEVMQQSGLSAEALTARDEG